MMAVEIEADDFGELAGGQTAPEGASPRFGWGDLGSERDRHAERDATRRRRFITGKRASG